MFVVEKDSYSLRENIDDLKNVLPQQAALLENNLDKIRESKTKRDLLKSASTLGELSESKQFEKKFKIDEKNKWSVIMYLPQELDLRWTNIKSLWKIQNVWHNLNCEWVESLESLWEL